MKLPQIGQTIFLNLSSDSDEIRSTTLKSRIADLDGDVAFIELPVSENTGRTVLYPDGSKCDVWYIAKDGCRYDFPAEIIGKRKGHIPLVLLKMPPSEQVKRTQRRNYLRINTGVEIAVRMEDSVRKYHFLARTVDLSGGGLSFTCDSKYRLNESDRLHIWMSLPSKTGAVSHAFAVTEIVRCQPPKEPGLHQWISGKFVQINESDQAKIVRACYERQLELRKKGIVE